LTSEIPLTEKTGRGDQAQLSLRLGFTGTRTRLE